MDLRASPLISWHLMGLWTPRAGRSHLPMAILEVLGSSCRVSGVAGFTFSSPVDVKKMPLGKLSKQQIARGFEALEELEAALREQPPQATRLEELSSRFYTIVPHNFGRARPPAINSPELLRAKKDMLLVRCQGTQSVANLAGGAGAAGRRLGLPCSPGTVPSTGGEDVPALSLPGAGRH